MKRIVRVALMCALVVLLTASIAAAATINCGGGNCSGTNGKDTINESSVNDNIFGGGGADRIFADPFRGETDIVNGGKGIDRINTDDNDNLDTIRCTKGDKVIADQGDKVTNKSLCASVKRS